MPREFHFYFYFPPRLSPTRSADQLQHVPRDLSGQRQLQRVRREIRSLSDQHRDRGCAQFRSKRAARRPPQLRSGSEAPSIAGGRSKPSNESNLSRSHVILMRRCPFVQMQCARAHGLPFEHIKIISLTSETALNTARTRAILIHGTNVIICKNNNGLKIQTKPHSIASRHILYLIIIAHRISHGTNVFVVSIQSNSSKKFCCLPIGCSHQQHTSVGYSVGYAHHGKRE